MTKFSTLKLLALGAASLGLYSCVPLDVDSGYSSGTYYSDNKPDYGYADQGKKDNYYPNSGSKPSQPTFGCNTYDGKCYGTQNPANQSGPVAQVVGFYKDSIGRAFALERISYNELYFIYLDKDCYFVNKAEYVNHINRDYLYFRVQDTKTPFYLRFDPNTGSLQTEGNIGASACIATANHPFYRTSTDGRVQDNYRRFYNLILDGKVEGNGYNKNDDFYDNKAPGENSWNHGYYRRGHQGSQWSVQEPSKNGQYYQGEGRFLTSESIGSQPLYKKDYLESNTINNSYNRSYGPKGFKYYAGEEFEPYPAYRYRVSDNNTTIDIEVVDKLLLVKPQGYSRLGNSFSIPLDGYKVKGVQYRDLDGDGQSELFFLLEKRLYNRQMVKVDSVKAVIFSPDRYTGRLTEVPVPDLINYNGYFGKDRWGYKDGLVTRTINTNIQGNLYRTFYYSLRNEGGSKRLVETNIKSWTE